MKTVSISTAELRRLKKDQRILEALQAGGVDNWEWYGDSLAPVQLEDEIEELCETFLEEVEVMLLQNAYEPSERGAGYCSLDEDRDAASVLLARFLRELDTLKKGEQ